MQLYHRRRTSPPASLMLCILCWVLLPVTATAQQGADFEDLYRQGNQLAQAGRPAQALAAYKQAYQANQVPVVLVAIGLMNLELGHFSDALKSCQKYLDIEKSGAAHEKAAACVAQARERLKETPVATGRSPQGTSQSAPAPSANPPRPAHTALQINEPLATASTLKARDHAWRPEQLPVDLKPSSSAGPEPAQSTPQRSTPIYKKWWFWTAIGVVAAGTAVGLGVGLTQSSGGVPVPVDPLADIPLANRRVITF